MTIIKEGNLNWWKYIIEKPNIFSCFRCGCKFMENEKDIPPIEKGTLYPSINCPCCGYPVNGELMTFSDYSRILEELEAKELDEQKYGKLRCHYPEL